MEKETIKEIGKYFLDISKIFMGLVLIAPFVKTESISIPAIGVTTMLAILGIYFTNKGVKDE